MKKILSVLLLTFLLTQGILAEEAQPATETGETMESVEAELDQQAEEMSEEAKIAKESKVMLDESNKTTDISSGSMNVERKESSFYKDHISSKLGFGLGFGTGGYELKGIYKFNKYFSTSLEYNYMMYEETFNDLGDKDENITADGSFTISSLKALAHWHPFGGGFRMSAGYVKNLSDLEIDVFGENVQLDEDDPETTSNLEGTIVIDTGDNLPYVGLGWGYDIEDRFALDFTIGVQFIQKIKGSDLIDYDITLKPEALGAYVDNVISGLQSGTGNEYYDQLKENGLDDNEINDVISILQGSGTQDIVNSGDPFELYDYLDEQGVLDDFGVEKSIAKAGDDDGAFSSLPNPDDYMTEIEDEIDTIVEDSGLGAIQDIFGFAPIPVASLGITVFLW
jgi:hypothetical protein